MMIAETTVMKKIAVPIGVHQISGLVQTAAIALTMQNFAMGRRIAQITQTNKTAVNIFAAFFLVISNATPVQTEVFANVRPDTD